MNKTLVLLVACLLSSCTQVKTNINEPPNQETVFKNWVLSRCLSYTFEKGKYKQDALNTASAYLEQSMLPVENLLRSEPLIANALSKDYQGSIKGTFNTKKCIDLFNSPKLDALYHSFDKDTNSGKDDN